MKKVKGLILVVVIAIAIFAILLSIEQNQINKYERIDIAVALEDVPKGSKITKDNVNKYFKIEKCSNNLKSAHSITDLSKLIGMYVKNDIYTAAVLKDNEFASYDFVNKAIEDEVMVSFGVTSIDAAMNGTLRMGDVVRIYVVANQGGEITGCLPYEVIIEKAYDSTGKLITPEDSAVIASNFNVAIDKADEADFYELLSTGTVKVVKVG
jgi:hypothetical protein